MKARRGQTITVDIAHLDEEARGCASFGDTTVHVPGTSPGTRADVRVQHVDRRGRIFAEVTTVHTAGPGLRQAPCHHAAPMRGPCGGCPLMHLDEAMQRAWKRDRTNAALAPLGVSVDALRTAGPALGWRNRTHLRVFRSASGALRLGSRARRTGDDAWMRGCLLVHPALQRTADAIEDLLRRGDAQVAGGGGAAPRARGRETRTAQGDARAQKGDARTAAAGDARAPGRDARDEAGARPAAGDSAGMAPHGASADLPLRHVSLRCNAGGEVLVELVGHSDFPPASMVQQVAALPGVVSVHGGKRDRPDNVLRSIESRHVAGSPELDASFLGRPLALGPATFAQLNTAVAEAMATRLVELVGADTGVDTAWDLYGGLGTLGHALLAAGAVRRVAGVEAVGEAVAIAMATGRGLPGGDASAWVEADLAAGVPEAVRAMGRPDLVVLNPPRRGMDAAAMKDVIASGAPRILSVSCDAGTFTHDAVLLQAAGWRLDHVEAWDMMPQTRHVELLGLFSRDD